ncbi:MAG: DUF1697 domain-containing protein, partial [Spirochaetales bacterium]|nr:DUF1697 domain-containing protein [Spirochaetales bacterium]
MEKTGYVTLLRGINVGGNAVIKMEALRAALCSLKFTDVKTYIQSGNIIFRAGETAPAKLAKKIEKKLAEEFGYDIPALVYTVNEYAQIVQEAPPLFGKEKEKYRYDVWFLLPPLSAEEVAASLTTREGVDRLFTGKRACYTTRLVEKLSKSYFSKVAGLPWYGNLTIRNW